MNVAERAGGIVHIGGENMRHAMFIAEHIHRAGQRRHCYAPFVMWFGMEKEINKGASCSEQQCNGKERREFEKMAQHAGSFVGYVRLTITVFFWVKCSHMDSSEASLPMPDCLNPP